MDTKIKFLARLLVLTLFSTFIGCNEELYDIKEQQNATDKNKISLAQFKNETNISGIEPILSVPTKTSLSSKTKIQLSDFVIDTLAIKKLISENNKTTYTFRIYPLFTVVQANEIYNLVYRKVNNTWETSIFYLKKLPKENNEHKLFEKIEIIYKSESKTSLTSKIAPNQLCAYEVILIKCNGSCKVNEPCDGIKCRTGECYTRIVAYVPCGEEPSGGSGGSLPYTGSSGGGGGGGVTDPYLFETNIYDNPDLSDPNFINILKRGDVWANLGYEGQDFFAKAENIGFFNETIQYQIENDWSPKSYEFAKQMRDRKMLNPTVFNSITPFIIEKNIDYSNLDPCTKAILDKLKNSTQSDIAAMLTHFAPAGSIFNINMTIGQVRNNDPYIWAQTTKVTGSSTDINMVFNQDYINGTGNVNRPTDLSIATTMVHEIIHAYLISLLQQNLACGSSAICDFPTVYEAYVQQQITKDKSILPDAHHELIAGNYVFSIASAIQEFHTGQPVGSGFPRQVYLDMALGGLTGTTFFNKNYPDDPNHKNYKDRERILARIYTEKSGSQYGINTPLGTPCKK